jgi:hypothetical protein
MIEFEIDTTRLKLKILAAARSIQPSIAQGVTQGAEQLEKQIDDFMFVPLALQTSVNQQSTETIATIGVNLNLPPTQPSRRFNRFGRKRHRHRSRVSRRRWFDYVRQLGQESNRELKVVIDAEIRRELP